MNRKQLLSLAVIAVGVILVGYGVYSKKHLSSAEAEVLRMHQSSNPIVKSVGVDVHKKMGQYGAKVKWSLFGGTALIVLGGVAFIIYHKKKRK
jgi:hypothetical protein